MQQEQQKHLRNLIEAKHRLEERQAELVRELTRIFDSLKTVDGEIRNARCVQWSGVERKPQEKRIDAVLRLVTERPRSIQELMDLLGSGRQGVYTAVWKLRIKRKLDIGISPYNSLVTLKQKPA